MRSAKPGNHLKFTTQKNSAKKWCLFKYNLPPSFRNKAVTMKYWFFSSIVWKYVFLFHVLNENENWFSHDVTKIQTKRLSILPRFYFHDALEQLKTNFHTNFRLKKVLDFVIEVA